MIRLFIALIVFITIVYIYNRSKRLSPKQRRNFILQIILYGLIGVLIFAVLTGRMHWIGAIIAGGLAVLKMGFATLIRMLPFLRLMKNTGNFGNPQFKTEHIIVRVNFNTNQMSGQILSGKYAGTQLTDLTSEQFNELEAQYKNENMRSYYILLAFKKTTQHFSKQSSHYEKPTNTDMSVDDALNILGIDGEPSIEDVKKAHRRLMQKLHPDHGGNVFLASQVNNAKEVLIRHLKKQ